MWRNWFVPGVSLVVMTGLKTLLTADYMMFTWLHAIESVKIVHCIKSFVNLVWIVNCLVDTVPYLSLSLFLWQWQKTDRLHRTIMLVYILTAMMQSKSRQAFQCSIGTHMMCVRDCNVFVNSANFLRVMLEMVNCHLSQKWSRFVKWRVDRSYHLVL